MALPKSKYEILCAIIAEMKNGPHGLVKAEPIAKKCGYSLEVVLQNFGFFTSVGILGPGMNKHLSDEGSLLSFALSVRDHKKILHYWRNIIDSWSDMRKMLSWLESNEGFKVNEVVDGIQAIYHKDASSSRFSLNCLIHLAHRTGYIKVQDGSLWLSEYSKELITLSPPQDDDDSNIEYPPDSHNFSTVCNLVRQGSPNSSHLGDGLHIHLHFGSDVSPAQVQNIFQSLALNVLSRPNESRQDLRTFEENPIVPIASNP